MKNSHNEINDLSEWLEGPVMIALRGNSQPTSEYRLGTREYAWHQHARGQLFCVEGGMIQVETPQGAWFLPPRRAGWIPAGLPHQVRISGALTGWSLLFTPEFAHNLPNTACVIGITELLSILVQRAEQWDNYRALSPEQIRIAQVILDEISLAPQQSLHLPAPKGRLQRITQAMMEQPGDPRTLEEWASLAAMSARTMRRLFLSETGLSFFQWRQQAQLSLALNMLANGKSVTWVADRLGYAAPSNFIAMFRRALGSTPAQFFKSAKPR